MLMDSISMEIWERFSRKLKSEKTRNYYLFDINEYSEMIGKPFYMGRKEDVEGYYEKMRRAISEHEIAGSTVLRKFRVLSRFSSEAMKMDIYPKQAVMRRNLFLKYVSALQSYNQREKARKMEVKQIDRLLEGASSDLTLYTIIAMIYRLGMSAPEICRLSCKDIFKEEGTAWYVSVNRKRHKYMISIPDDLRKIMEKYEKKYRCWEEGADTPYFPNEGARNTTKWMSERVLEMRVKEIADRCHLPGITLGDTRNSAAVLMFAYDADVQEVADQLGIRKTNVYRYKTHLTDHDISTQASEFVNLRVCLPEEKRAGE